MTKEEQMVAEFLKTRGATKVAEGEKAMSFWEMKKATRGERYRTFKEIEEQKLINQREVVIDHTGREHVRNGLGEWIS